MAKGSCASTRASTCTRTGRPARPAPTCATRPSAVTASCGAPSGRSAWTVRTASQFGTPTSGSSPRGA
eukprot:14022960-Alexandrium_andersonii.AAC.1